MRAPLGMTPVDRFWLYVRKSDPSKCWPWSGTRDENGYGKHYVARRGVKAHRYSYELLVGPIPDGLVIDHLCRNPSCVNPDHLEPVTTGENTRRGNAVKTACPQGHRYDEANTLITKKGGRACRECNRLNSAQWRAARSAVAS